MQKTLKPNVHFSLGKLLTSIPVPGGVIVLFHHPTIKAHLVPGELTCPLPARFEVASRGGATERIRFP